MFYEQPALREFFQSLVQFVDARYCRYFVVNNHQNYNIPQSVERVESLHQLQEESCMRVNIAILDFYLGWFGQGGKFAYNHEFDVALSVLSKLSNGKLAFITVGASGLWLEIGQRFQAELKKIGWNVLGYVELPKEGLNISFEPLLAVLSRTEVDGLFTASITDQLDESVVVSSLFQLNEEQWAKDGHLSDRQEFRGFHVERIRSELRFLLKAESGFQLYRLGDFVSETNSHRREQAFDLGKTQVAISKILGSSDRDVVLTHGDEPNFRHEWIVASLTDGLLPSYFKMFMNSELGRKCLEVAADGSVMRFVSMKNLLETQIPIPSVETQQSLVSTFDNLVGLQSQISRLEKELVFNPKNVDAVSSDVVSLLGSIGRLTAVDEVKARVRSGENKTTEFKETLSWDVRKEEKAKYIEQSALKTIAGFLNSDGGTLLIGVNDKGEIPGVEFEINKLHKGDTDKFLLHFKNLVKDKLGEKFYLKIDWALEQVDGRKVLVVKTGQGAEPAFIDDVFYVRTNPATDQLQGERLYKYLAERFKVGFT